MSQPPYRGQRMHPNSIEAYLDLDIPARWRAVFEVFVDKHPKNLTDRDVLYYLTGSNGGDMNKVRPRITEMVQDQKVPLWEKGRTRCRYTGKLVRVVGLAEIDPQPCNIPREGVLIRHAVGRKIEDMYPTLPGQQALFRGKQ